MRDQIDEREAELRRLMSEADGRLPDELRSAMRLVREYGEQQHRRRLQEQYKVEQRVR